MPKRAGAARQWVLKAADVAGAAVLSVPGLAGAAAIAWGAAQIYVPAGWICAGVALILIDRRLP